MQPKGVPTVKDGFFVVDLWRTLLALMLSIAVLKDEDTNLVTNPRRTRLALMTSSRVIGVGSMRLKHKGSRE